MSCQRCKSDNLCNITAKSSDLNDGDIVGVKFDGYVPYGVGIGGGDYVEICWCLECGQIQGEFPLETPEEYVKKEKTEEEKIDIDDLLNE